MISYAGQNLLLEDQAGKLSRFADHYLSLDDLRIFGAPTAIADERTGSFKNCLLAGTPTPNWPDPSPLRINSLYWPTGAARWAFGLFLVDQNTNDSIVEALPGNATAAQLIIADSSFNSVVEPDGFTVDRNGRAALSTAMFCLPPRQVSPTDSLWLLPLVDVRYYWQFRLVPPSFTPATWDDAFGTLGTALGITVNSSAVDSAFCSPDFDLLAVEGTNAALMLDAMAASVGQRIIRQPSGDVWSYDATESGTEFDDNISGVTRTQNEKSTQLAGGDFSAESLTDITPEKVSVMFPGATPDDPLVVVDELASSHTLETWVAGTKKSISIPWFTVATGEEGAAQPTTSMNDLASALAGAYYDYIGKWFDLTFASVKKWQTTGYDNYTEWSCGLRRKDGTYSAQTRIQSLPYNFGIDEVLPYTCGGLGDKPSCGTNKIKRVILDAALASGSTAAASEYKWDTGTSAWVDTGNTLTVSEILGVCSDIASGTVCAVAKLPGIGWSVISAQCTCDEVQRILITGSPTGGTYTLTFDGQTTAAIQWNAATVDVRAALEALSNIDVGDVLVTGGPHPGTAIDVEFIGQYENTDVSEMTATSSLTGGTYPAITVTTIQGGG